MSNIVVALPGAMLGRASYGPLSEAVNAAKYVLVAHSFPGYDRRARLAPETPSPRDYAADLMNRVAVLGVPKVHLMAHGASCATALAAAAVHPDAIASVTLIGYRHIAPEWESQKVIAQQGIRVYAKNRAPALAAAPRLYPQIVKLAEVSVTDVEGYLQMARSVCAYSAEADLAAVTQPIHFIVGDKDAVTLPAAQIAVAQAKEGATLTVMNRIGHCAQLEDPAAVARVSKSFWKQAGV